jgi:hypothetical protein
VVEDLEHMEVGAQRDGLDILLEDMVEMHIITTIIHKMEELER